MPSRLYGRGGIETDALRVQGEVQSALDPSVPSVSHVIPGACGMDSVTAVSFLISVRSIAGYTGSTLGNRLSM